MSHEYSQKTNVVLGCTNMSPAGKTCGETLLLWSTQSSSQSVHLVSGQWTPERYTLAGNNLEESNTIKDSGPNHLCGEIWTNWGFSWGCPSQNRNPSRGIIQQEFSDSWKSHLPFKAQALGTLQFRNTEQVINTRLGKIWHVMEGGPVKPTV